MWYVINCLHGDEINKKISHFLFVYPVERICFATSLYLYRIITVMTHFNFYAGQQLAEWLVNGYPSLDVFGYDINRFNPTMTDNDKWINERSHESYAKNYSIVFPMDEPLASRNMRKSPIHEELLKHGCVFQERHGFERPAWFSIGDDTTILDYDYYGEYDHESHPNYPYRV